MTIAGISLTTGSISYGGSGNTNATNMQMALGALPGIGSVTVNYQADPNWYVVQFGPQMGQPGLSAFGANLTFTFMKGNPNQQALTIAGSTGQSFTLTLTVGTVAGAVTTLTTGLISIAGTSAGTAGNIQTALAALATVGAGNVTVTYNSTNGWYVVTFNPSLGAPVMTANVISVSGVTVTVLQSGAAVVIPNLYGLRIFGHGSALADYDQPGGGTGIYAPSSRSLLKWVGTANGIMLHLLGCNNVTIENLGFVGATSASATNAARTGLLFSSNPSNPAGSQGGSGLTCRSAVFTRCQSTATPAASGCVQLGMNASDSGGDTTSFEACILANGTNGLLSLSSAAVNHHLSGTSAGTFAGSLLNGAWFIQGGNALWDGCKAAGITGSVLKIGPASVGSPAQYGGGPNASAFILRNVRTDPLGGPNITVADTTTAAAGTTMSIEGWNDTMSSPAAGINFIQAVGAPTSTSGTGTPQVTLNSVGAGHTLIAFGGLFGTTPPAAATLADTQGNVWVQIPNSGVGTTGSASAAWYCASAAAGNTVITFTSGATDANLVVYEFSGVDPAQPVDVMAAATGLSTAPSCGSLTTRYAGDALVAYTSMGDSSVTYNPGTGFTMRVSNGNGPPVQPYAAEDQFNAAIGTYAPGFSQNPSSHWTCIGLALKAAGAAVVIGAGANVQLRDSLVNRPILAEEGSANPPTSAITVALRVENLIVPEGQIGANLCQNLTANTKVDHSAERTATYGVVRPDVSTMIGRPRYSRVNWIILQQKPKFFYDLGDIGFVAPNQGWKLYISPSVPRTDGQYTGTYTQNVQSIVAGDAIGGFNTLGTGYVNLLNGNLWLGQISGQNWSILAVVIRSSSASNQHILSNLSGTLGGGGLDMWLSSTGIVNLTSDNGTVQQGVESVTAAPLIVPTYILIRAQPSNNTISVHLNGNPSADAHGTITSSIYADNSIVPVIGAAAGPPPTPSNIQIARLAVFDGLFDLGAWANLYAYGTGFQGR